MCDAGGEELELAQRATGSREPVTKEGWGELELSVSLATVWNASANAVMWTSSPMAFGRYLDAL